MKRGAKGPKGMPAWVLALFVGMPVVAYSGALGPHQRTSLVFLVPATLALALGIPLLVRRRNRVAASTRADGWTCMEPFEMLADSARELELVGRWTLRPSSFWGGTLLANADRLAWTGFSDKIQSLYVNAEDIVDVEWSDGGSGRSSVLTLRLRDGRTARMFSIQRLPVLKANLAASGLPAFQSVW